MKEGKCDAVDTAVARPAHHSDIGESSLAQNPLGQPLESLSLTVYLRVDCGAPVSSSRASSIAWGTSVLVRPVGLRSGRMAAFLGFDAPPGQVWLLLSGRRPGRFSRAIWHSTSACRKHALFPRALDPEAGQPLLANQADYADRESSSPCGQLFG